jgi:hypothetical protein
MYIAIAADAAVRAYDAAAAFNFAFMFLLANCPYLILFYSFGLRSLSVIIQTMKDAKVTFPITVLALPVRTNHAENNPTKVQISEKKSFDTSLKNCFII